MQRVEPGKYHLINRKNRFITGNAVVLVGGVTTYKIMESPEKTSNIKTRRRLRKEYVWLPIVE